VPPLRERRGDIRPLAERFAAEYELVLPEPALAFLGRLDWPGNVRQLRNVIERSCAVAGQPGELTLELVQRSALDEGAVNRKEGDKGAFVQLAVGETLESRLEAEERRQVKYALESCGGNRTHAARLLSISRQSLHKRLKRFGLEG
jgi:transcriptional regulator with PAS, ATPase and Fis domain